MAKGTTVQGSMSIRVHPDTKGFASELRAYLQNLENKYRARPVKIAAEFDNQSLQTIAQQIEAIRDKAASIKVKPEWDASDLGDITKDARETIRVHTDVDQGSLAAAQNALNRWRDRASREPVDISADWGDALRDLSREARANRDIRVPANLDPEIDRARLARTEGDLRERLGKAGKIVLDIDDSSFKKITTGLAGLNTSLDFVRTLRAAAAEADHLSMAAGRTAQNLTVMGAGAAGMVAAIGTLGQDLGSVLRGAALMAPTFAGAFTAVRLAFSALKIHLEGAFSDLSWSMGRALGSGLEQTGVLKSAHRLGQRWTEAFFTPMQGLGKEFGQFIEDSFDIAGTYEVMDNLSAVIDGTAGFFREAHLAGGFFIAGLADLAGAGAKYLPALGKGFRQLSIDFVDWSNTVTKNGDFDRWIKDAVANFKALVSIGASSVSILDSIGRAATAAGMGGLPELAAGLEAVAKALASPAWQTSLETYFKGFIGFAQQASSGALSFVDAIRQFAPTFQQMANISGAALGSILQLFADLMNHNAVRGGLVNLLTGVANGFEALQKVSAPLGTAIGGILTLFGALYENVMQVAATFAAEFGPAIADITLAFAGLMPHLEDIATGFIRWIAPAIRSAASAFRNFAEEHPRLAAVLAITLAAIGPVVTILGSVVSVGAKVVGAVSKIAGAFKNVVKAPAGFINVLRGVGLAVTRLVAPIGLAVGAFALMWSKSEPLRESLGRLWESLQSLGKAFLNTIQPLGGALSGIWNAIKPFVDGILDFIGRIGGGSLALVIDTLATAFQLLAAVLSGDFNAAWQILKDHLGNSQEIFNEVKDALGDLLGTLAVWGGKAAKAIARWGLDLASGIWNWITDTENGLMQWLADVIGWFSDKSAQIFDAVVSWGADVAKGIWEWITASEGGLADWLESIYNWFVDNGPTIAEKVGEWSKNIGEGIANWVSDTDNGLLAWIDGIAQWLSDNGPTIAEAVGEMAVHVAEGIANWIADTDNGLLAFLASVGQWFIDHTPEILEIGLKIGGAILQGIGNIAGPLIDRTLGLIWDWVKSWFIIKATQITMEVMLWVEGIKNGIATWWGGTLGALQGWWNSVVSWFQNLPINIMLTVQGWVHGIVMGISTWWGGTIGALQGWWNGVIGFFATLPGRIGVQVMTWVQGIMRGISTWWGGTMGALQGWWSQVLIFFSTLPSRIMTQVMMWVQGIMRGISTWWGGTLGALQGWWNGVLGFFATLPSRIFNSAREIGSNIVRGIVNGLATGLGWVQAEARKLAQSAINAAKNVLGINSPSKKFRQIGAWVSEGMAIGIESESSKAVAQVDKMSKAMLDSARNRTSNLMSALYPEPGAMPTTAISRINAARNSQKAQPGGVAAGASYHVHLESTYDEQRAVRRGAEELATMINRYALR